MAKCQNKLSSQNRSFCDEKYNRLHPSKIIFRNAQILEQHVDNSAARARKPARFGTSIPHESCESYLEQKERKTCCPTRQIQLVSKRSPKSVKWRNTRTFGIESYRLKSSEPSNSISNFSSLWRHQVTTCNSSCRLSTLSHSCIRVWIKRKVPLMVEASPLELTWAGGPC